MAATRFEVDGVQREHGLPGGRTKIDLLHSTFDGLTFDRLTVPLTNGLSIDAVVDEFLQHRLG